MVPANCIRVTTTVRHHRTSGCIDHICEKMLRIYRIEIPISNLFELTVSSYPNHHRFWPKPFDSVAHICHADTSDSSGIQCHRPTACAAFDILRYRYHTRDDRTVAAIIIIFQIATN